MSLPKQKKDESDADYAVRLEKAKKRIKEYHRKRYEANKEAAREYRRSPRRREANKEAARRYRKTHREALRRRDRERTVAKTLANAKGVPLKSNYARARRPEILTRLILKVAEDFCRNYGFPLESKWDTDVLKHAANTIRDSPELDGAPNPWYGTDYLNRQLINTRYWPNRLRTKWRDKA